MAKALRLARPEFGLCRTLNHAWTPEGPVRRQGGVVLVSLRCTVCTTMRRDTILLQTGEVITRSYYHPEGYLMPRGEGPSFSKQDFRREWVRGVLRDPATVTLRESVARPKPRQRRESA